MYLDNPSSIMRERCGQKAIHMFYCRLYLLLSHVHARSWQMSRVPFPLFPPLPFLTSVSYHSGCGAE